MIERVFIFDCWGCRKQRVEYFGNDWEKSYETMRGKYERNGYVLPKIVHWVWYYDYLRVTAVWNSLIRVTRSSEENFRIFLESDGMLDPTVEDEPKKSKIRKEDYSKLVLYD